MDHAEYVRLQAAVNFEVPNETTCIRSSAPDSAVQAFYYASHPRAIQLVFRDKDIFLIWGGSTGVDHSSIQLANASNLRVFATSASTALHDDSRRNVPLSYHCLGCIVKNIAGHRCSS
ncbi:hypothetical protein BT96DRAFT_921260 [Gymnopus androsaceus JB14]|uniref:Uncharacterized protein n=1 Tax=Gymnopus androsaceus JB14 TaxID=1447944 RepID=A0A6A4HGH1_9AGAR|nr:hypothetical protein BT96DRAFT_921260 [Gymnopus androsaceus JB14]